MANFPKGQQVTRDGLILLSLLQAAGGGGASWSEHGERGARAGVPAAPLRAVLHPGHGLGTLLR